jgi:PKD repeat protein
MRRSISLSFASCCVSFFSLIGLSAAPAQAQACPDDTSCQFRTCRSPASAAPAQLWGELRPATTGALPATRDNTAFDEFGDPFNENNPFWMSLDIENGYIFTAINVGMQIWDARTNPASPTRTAVIGRASFPAWTTDPHEFYPVRDIDAPPGNDSIVAVALTREGGLAVFNTTSKTSPAARYGDTGKWTEQVYSAAINGVNYAFTANKFVGLLSYNLSAVAARTTLCTESTPSNTCGVYVGRLGSRQNFSYVDGVGNANGTAHWVVGSLAGSERGLQIWNVSNPSTPQLVVEALTTELAVHGVALWRQGSSYFLATRIVNGSGTQARIYNVSCMASGSCSTLGAPIWTATLPNGGAGLFVTHSETNGRHFVYFGDVDKCGSGLQHEWLYDVTNPGAPFDITPAPGQVGDQLTGYWGWYYRRNPTGFNSVMPRMGLFNGNYFYRAAFSIFDVHELTSGGPPTAAFTYTPNPPYAGQPVSFTDTSTGAPTDWTWTFQGGTPGSSTQENPTGVTFATPGSKQVSLNVENAFGQDTETQTVNVLDPTASVASASVTPNPALVCQPITFTANTVTGFPAPALSWVVRDGQGLTVASGGNVNPFVWSTVGVAAGNYTATVTAGNTSGTDTATSPTLTLAALPSLPAGGTFSPTAEAPANGFVQFHVVAAGATEWNWNFGDGNTTGWINDPVAGPNPTHAYDAVGTYTVSVQVRNCVEAARTSGTVQVQITQVTPLEASFSASNLFCTGNGCFANLNQSITFSDTSTGAPTNWDYDWNGDGTFEDANNTTPRTSHTYSTAGTYSPVLRIRKGAASATDTHPAIIVSGTGGGGNPPVVTVSGPSSGQTGANLTYTAGASNCTPQPASWTWTLPSGATATGSTNQSSITVSFSTVGSKTMTAVAGSGGCTGSSGLSGSKTTTITAPGGGGGGTLDAVFTVNPAAPNVGQSTAFDASTSTGGPTGFNWQFGDGSSGSGVQATHTYAQAGTYTVTLEVSKPDSSCSFNLCTDRATRQVVVGGGGGGGVTASFTATGASCTAFNCSAQAGQNVSLSSTSQGATTFEWVFGDGGTATGATVSHAWNQAGSFLVTLTARNAAGASSTSSKLFEITGVATSDRTVVVPWVANTTGAIDQVTDLYVTNPATTPMNLELTFRKRGPVGEDDPPVVNRTIPAKGTLIVSDAVDELFDRDNTYGYLVLVAKNATVDPVAVALNRTFQDDGGTYGQVIQGLPLGGISQLTSHDGTKMVLLGLHDTNERLSLLGLTNPYNSLLIYRMKFVDKNGVVISEPNTDFLLGAWGQKQFQPQELRNLFGIQGEDDFRVEITRVAGGTPFPYVDLVRLGTQDPSFVRASRTADGKVYLLCASSTPAFNNALFQSDLLLSNPSTQAMTVEVTYRNVGPNAVPLPTQNLTLQPNETMRVDNLVTELFGLSNNVGLLTLESDGVGGLFPMIQGETYQNSGPSTRYGLFMPARTEAEAASLGQSIYLSGLRQKDNEASTTLWLLNPAAELAVYDIIYRDKNGTELGRAIDFLNPAGAVRQVNPSFHPLPAGGVNEGFSIEINVKAGKLIAGGQVVINQSNDPAYVIGIRP